MGKGREITYNTENTKGPFTKDVRLTPVERGLQNPDVPLLFECNSIVLSGRRGMGSRNHFLNSIVLSGRRGMGSRNPFLPLYNDDYSEIYSDIKTLAFPSAQFKSRCSIIRAGGL